MINEFAKIKEALAKQGKSLDIQNGDHALMVACYLNDLLDDFSLVYEEDNDTDPYAEILESQYSLTHQLFRKILKREHGFHFKKKDFGELYQMTRALIAGLLGIGLFKKLKKHKADK